MISKNDDIQMNRVKSPTEKKNLELTPTAKDQRSEQMHGQPQNANAGVQAQKLGNESPFGESEPFPDVEWLKTSDEVDVGFGADPYAQNETTKPQNPEPSKPPQPQAKNAEIKAIKAPKTKKAGKKGKKELTSLDSMKAATASEVIDNNQTIAGIFDGENQKATQAVRSQLPTSEVGKDAAAIKAVNQKDAEAQQQKVENAANALQAKNKEAVTLKSAEHASALSKTPDLAADDMDITAELQASEAVAQESSAIISQESARAEARAQEFANSASPDFQAHGFEDVSIPSVACEDLQPVQLKEPEYAAEFASLSGESKTFFDQCEIGKAVKEQASACTAQYEAAQMQYQQESQKFIDKNNEDVKNAKLEATQAEQNVISEQTASFNAELSQMNAECTAQIEQCSEEQQAVIQQSQQELAENANQASKKIEDAQKNAEKMKEEKIKQEEKSWFGKACDWISERVDSIVKSISDTFNSKIQTIKDELKAANEWIKEHISETLANVLASIGEFLEWFINKIANLVKYFAEIVAGAISKLWEDLYEKLEKYFKTLEDALKAFVEVCNNFAKNGFSWENLGNLVVTFFKTIFSTLGIDASFLDLFVPAGKAFLDNPGLFFTTFWSGLKLGGSEFVNNLATNIKTIVKNLLNLWLKPLKIKAPDEFNAPCLIKFALELVGIDVDGIIEKLGLTDIYEAWSKSHTWELFGLNERIETEKNDAKARADERQGLRAVAAEERKFEKMKAEGYSEDVINHADLQANMSVENPTRAEQFNSVSKPEEKPAACMVEDSEKTPTEKFLENLEKEGLMAAVKLLWEEGGIFEVIQDILINIAKGFLEELFKKLMKKLVLMTNPVGGILAAVEAAWNVFQFFREKVDAIVGLFGAISTCISQAALGNEEGVANALVALICQSIPLFVDLALRLFGFNVGDIIKKWVGGFRETIDKAILSLRSFFQASSDKKKHKKNKDNQKNAETAKENPNAPVAENANKESAQTSEQTTEAKKSEDTKNAEPPTAPVAEKANKETAQTSEQTPDAKTDKEEKTKKHLIKTSAEREAEAKEKADQEEILEKADAAIAKRQREAILNDPKAGFWARKGAKAGLAANKMNDYAKRREDSSQKSTWQAIEGVTSVFEGKREGNLGLDPGELSKRIPGVKTIIKKKEEEKEKRDYENAKAEVSSKAKNIVLDNITADEIAEITGKDADKVDIANLSEADKLKIQQAQKTKEVEEQSKQFEKTRERFIAGELTEDEYDKQRNALKNSKEELENIRSANKATKEMRDYEEKIVKKSILEKGEEKARKELKNKDGLLDQNNLDDVFNSVKEQIKKENEDKLFNEAAKKAEEQEQELNKKEEEIKKEIDKLLSKKKKDSVEKIKLEKQLKDVNPESFEYQRIQKEINKLDGSISKKSAEISEQRDQQKSIIEQRQTLEASNGYSAFETKKKIEKQNEKQEEDDSILAAAEIALHNSNISSKDIEEIQNSNIPVSNKTNGFLKNTIDKASKFVHLEHTLDLKDAKKYTTASKEIDSGLTESLLDAEKADKNASEARKPKNLTDKVVKAAKEVLEGVETIPETDQRKKYKENKAAHEENKTKNSEKLKTSKKDITKKLLDDQKKSEKATSETPPNSATHN